MSNLGQNVLSKKQRKSHNEGIRDSSAQTEISTFENFVGFVESNIPGNNNVSALPG